MCQPGVYSNTKVFIRNVSLRFYAKSKFCVCFEVHIPVLRIFVTENCVDGIENRRSQLDLLYIEYSVHDGYLVGWIGIRAEQTEFRLVTMKFHRKINTVQNKSE